MQAKLPALITPERVTVDTANHEQLLYFTSSSLLRDDRTLVFLSERSGSPNIFSRDLASGEERQLTFNNKGILKSYVYFNGTPYQGLSKASISLDTRRGLVYYIQGRQICRVNMQGQVKVLAEYPHDQMTAFTHVSADGSRLCVPTTDARALDGDQQLDGAPEYDIDARVQQEDLFSYLRIYDTVNGELLHVEPVKKAWITHVQFAPKSNHHILYNHEYPSDCGIRRMWLYDGKCHLRLRTENNVRSREDFTCHEMWEREGSAIIYHGVYHNGRGYVGRVNSDGSGLCEIPFPANFIRYGHFTVGKPGMLVSDGYYQTAGETPEGGGLWISLLHCDWQRGTIDWLPLCRSGTSWDSQDSHPHPIFDHTAKYVYFTSDMDGKRAVYRVAVPSL